MFGILFVLVCDMYRLNSWINFGIFVVNHYTFIDCILGWQYLGRRNVSFCDTLFTSATHLIMGRVYVRNHDILPCGSTPMAPRALVNGLFERSITRPHACVTMKKSNLQWQSRTSCSSVLISRSDFMELPTYRAYLYPHYLFA